MQNFNRKMTRKSINIPTALVIGLGQKLFDVKPTWGLSQMLWQLFLILGVFTPLSIYKGKFTDIGCSMAYINPSYIAESLCWLTFGIFEYQLSSDEQRCYRMWPGQEDSPLCQTEFTLWQMQSMCKQRSSLKRLHKGSRNM